MADDLERHALDDAYAAVLVQMFQTLVTGMATEGSDGEPLERFRRGLMLVRAARALALARLEAVE